jgi:transcriptional regulator with XRE-family HTH domain
MKTDERLIARALRREEGLSVREIAAAVGVARSTASLWLRDVPLTEEQRTALLARNPAYNVLFNGSRANAVLARARRAKWQEDGRRRARLLDASYLVGCALYWAEGDKNRNRVALANSDPELIRLFVRFLRDHFGVRDAQIRVACNLFADHQDRQSAIENFWLDVVGVSRDCLHKSTVNVYSKHSSRKRRNMLPYGTCRVTVGSTEIAQTIYGSIQEMGSFDRPDWLD